LLINHFFFISIVCTLFCTEERERERERKQKHICLCVYVSTSFLPSGRSREGGIVFFYFVYVGTCVDTCIVFRGVVIQSGKNWGLYEMYFDFVYGKVHKHEKKNQPRIGANPPFGRGESDLLILTFATQLRCLAHPFIGTVRANPVGTPAPPGDYFLPVSF